MIKDIIYTVGSKSVYIVIAFLINVIISRILGPEGKGVVALVTTVTTIGVQLINLGLHSSNTYYLSKDIKKLNVIIGNSLFASLVISSIFAIFAGFVDVYIYDYIPLEGSLLWISLGSIPFSFLFLLIQNLFFPLSKVSFYNLLNIFSKSIIVLFLLALVYTTGLNALSASATYFISIVISSIFALFLLWNTSHFKPQISKTEFFHNFEYGLKSYLGSLFMFLVLKIDLIMIGNLTTKSDAGQYSLAVNLTDILYLIPSTISLIIFPSIVKQNSRREKWNTILRYFLISFIFLFLLTVFFWFLGDEIIQIIFGEEFNNVILSLKILLIAQIFLSISSFLGLFLASINVPRSGPVYSAIILILNFALNELFIKKYGFIGAAYSSLICYVLFIPYVGFYTIKILRNHDYTPNW